MKNTLFTLVRSGIAAGMVLAVSHFAFGQSETTTTTTTSSAGTITTFDPQTIVIKSETSTEPVRYRYTKTTTYVDENGNPVSIETVKSGLPVTVYYDREGDGMVARKVVVRRAVTTDAGAPAVVEKQTTTEGTISAFDPQQIVVKTEGGAEPIRYHYTKTTTYVDENGQPVSIETVKSGLPVTVYYEKDGDDMIARKVIVRHVVAPVGEPPPGTVIEHKKTTTTTTDEK
jgi:hypothetical protein